MKDECVNGGCPTNIILRKIFTLTICVLSHIAEPKQSNQAMFALQQLQMFYSPSTKGASSFVFIISIFK